MEREETIQLKTVKVLSANVLDSTLEEMVMIADDSITHHYQRFGTGINLNQLYLMRTNKEFADAISQAVLLPPDGTPLMWISRWMGEPLKGKVVGPDYSEALCELAAKKNYKVFILGGKVGSAQIAIDNLRKKYGFFEADYYCPPFGFEKDPAEVRKIVSLLKNSKADILLMALSAPKQEIFVEKYRREFGIPVIFGAGIAVDYFAGRIKQAPIWVNSSGMEWLYRMVQEPKRLFKRYIIHDLPVLFHMYFWAKDYKKNRKKTRVS